ncbi:MAG: baseplate J/gp47 family protein [Patescibacteria group bacterium]|nr:baseplate J/gp47 family protein [Patescibacteria group bacterium]
MPVEPKTIYLEADEEITSVIDKLRKTEFKDVVLIIPKEASLLQSVVNLKLIKRQAENLGKTVSLVTQDKVGRNLADKVGLATAAKLGQEFSQPNEEKENKPEGSTEPSQKNHKDESPIEDTNEVVFKKNPTEETVSSDDLVVSEDEDTEAEAMWHKKELEEKTPKNLMPKFPKKKLFLIGVPIVLIILIAGFVFLPRAKATIYVQAEKKPVSIDFSGEKDAKVDTEKDIIPSQVIESTKESSKKYAATGKKNVGTKATGTLRISNASGDTIAWVAGTRFAPTSNSSLIYRATSAITAPDGAFTPVAVEADQPGDQYNGFGSNQAFTLVSGSLGSSVTITCQTGMTGGTNKEVTFVSQTDINNAKSELSKEALGDATTDFNKKAENLKVIDDSKKEEIVSASASPALNGEAAEFTMTVKATVKALAYNMNDISALIKADVEKEYGFSKQVVDNGSNNVEVSISSSDLATAKISGTAKTNAYVANKLNESQIKDELKGTSSTKATNYLKGLEGVEDVKLQFWPSFIKYFPRIKNNIYIKIEISDNSNN